MTEQSEITGYFEATVRDYWTREIDGKAECGQCHREAPVCCDAALTQLDDGSVWHDSPHCSDCHGPRFGWYYGD